MLPTGGRRVLARLVGSVLRRLKETDPDVIDAVADVDRSQIRYALDLTPAERLERAFAVARALEGYRRVALRTRPRRRFALQRLPLGLGGPVRHTVAVPRPPWRNRRRRRLPRRPRPAGLEPTPRQLDFVPDKPNATLEIYVPWADGWREVCRDRCWIRVRPGDTYQVSGDGVRTSSPFIIGSSSTPLLVEAKTASKAPWVTGIVLTPVGEW